MNKEDTNEKEINQAATEQDVKAENESVASKTESKDTDSVHVAVVEDNNKESVLTPEEIKALKEQAAKADEYWNKLLHLVADFDNFKKRSERKRQDDVLAAKVAVVETFLPILDNFEMAFSAAANVTDAAAKSLKQGIEMVLSQFHNVLSDCGVECIDPKGKEFDHSYHEAVSEQETNEVPPGYVVQVLRKGYKMGDRLIRAARVIVARKTEAKKEEAK